MRVLKTSPTYITDSHNVSVVVLEPRPEGTNIPLVCIRADNPDLLNSETASVRVRVKDLRDLILILEAIAKDLDPVTR